MLPMSTASTFMTTDKNDISIAKGVLPILGESDSTGESIFVVCHDMPFEDVVSHYCTSLGLNKGHAYGIQVVPTYEEGAVIGIIRRCCLDIDHVSMEFCHEDQSPCPASLSFYLVAQSRATCVVMIIIRKDCSYNNHRDVKMYDMACFISSLLHFRPTDRELVQLTADWFHLHHASRDEDSIKLRLYHTHSSCLLGTVSLEELISENSEEFFCFQLTENNQPYALGFMTKWQQEHIINSSVCDVLLLDSSLSSFKHGYSFYCIVGVQKSLKSVPLAFGLCRQNDEESLNLLLDHFKLKVFQLRSSFRVPYIIVNGEQFVVSAVRDVFIDSRVVVSYFHVLQSALLWLNTPESGIDGNDDFSGNVRKIAVRLMRDMRAAETQDVALHLWHNSSSILTPSVRNYLEVNWVQKMDLWWSLGLSADRSIGDAISALESYWPLASHTFMKNIGNQSNGFTVEGLLRKVLPYFSLVITDLIEAERRLTSRKEPLQKKKALVQKENLEFCQSIVWRDNGTVLMPSFTETGTFYEVNPAEMICECTWCANGSLCKHLYLCEFLFSLKIKELRNKLFQRAVDEGLVLRFGSKAHVSSPLSGRTSIVDLYTFKCNCFAASWRCGCFCELAAKATFSPSSPVIENIRKASS